MKPRLREPQTQSSRMVLRNADHRDAIYNDMYHNAMWANTEDIDDELVWVKYPKHAMLLVYGESSLSSGTFCWMDCDRQFQYGRSWGGGYTRGRGEIFGLECGIAVAYSQSGSNESNFSVSDDGIVWQDIDANFNPNKGDIFHFGENGLCNITMGSVVMDEHYPFDHAGFVLRVALFSKNEETGKFEVEVKVFSYTDIVRTCQFVCNTKQGAVFNTTYGATSDPDGHMGAYDYTFWHIDHAGVKTEKHKDIWATNTIWDNLMTSTTRPYAYAKVGNRCFAVVAVLNKTIRTGTEYYARCHLLCSNDQGATWIGDMIYELHTDVYNIPSIVVNIKVCDGEVFAFYAVNTQAEGRKTHMMCTLTGTSWTEVELPTWLDVPVIAGGGMRVEGYPSKDTIRIAVDPPNTSNYDYTLASILGDPRYDTNMRGMGTMFSDGKLVKETDEVMRFMFGGTAVGQHIVFFDNRYLAENAKAFAWQIGESSVYGNIPDYVEMGDYCVPYEPTPFDPTQYLFWDYYKWVADTQEYAKVPRVTIPSYTTYTLVVVEYLPQVGANNVLYKVPRYNV